MKGSLKGFAKVLPSEEEWGSEEDSQEIDYRLGSELFAKYICALRDADIGSIDERDAFEAFILEQNFGNGEMINVPSVLQLALEFYSSGDQYYQSAPQSGEILLDLLGLDGYDDSVSSCD